MVDNIYEKQVNSIFQTFKIPKNILLDDEFTMGVFENNDHTGENYLETANILKPIRSAAKDLLSIFKHIVAGEGKENIFESCYTFINEGLDSSVNNKDQAVKKYKHAINFSKEAAEEFLHNLIKTAKKSCEGGDSVHQSHYIRGHKGIGKTFFINYLTSYYQKTLIRKKVIWIRANLTRNMPTYTVKNRLDKQAIYIIKKFYFDNDRCQINYSDFEEWLRNDWKNSNLDTLAIEDRIFQTIEQIKNSTKTFDRNVDLGDENYSIDNVFKKICNFFIEREYSFIFVIDGLDAIQPTDACEKDFKSWISEILRFATTPPYKGAWITSLRTESLSELSAQNNFEAIRESVESHLYDIYSPCLFTALSKRMMYYREPSSFLTEVQLLNLRNLIMAVIHTSVQLDTMSIRKVTQNSFVPYHNPSERFRINAKIFTVLIRFYGDDVRRFFDNIQRIITRLIAVIAEQAHYDLSDINSPKDIEDILKDKISVMTLSEKSWSKKVFKVPEPWKTFLNHISYKLVNTIVCGNKTFHNSPFKYEYCEQLQEVKIKLSEHYSVESGTLPNIYEFDSRFGNSFSKLSHEQYIFNQFSKLILLVYINFCSGKSVMRTSLELSLEKLGLSKYVTQCCLHELCYYGTIRKRVIGNQENYEILDAGIFLVTRLAWNSDYIDSIMNTTWIPKTLFYPKNEQIGFYVYCDPAGIYELAHNFHESDIFSKRVKHYWNRLVHSQYLLDSWEEAIKQLIIPDKCQQTINFITEGLGTLRFDSCIKISRFLYVSNKVEDYQNKTMIEEVFHKKIYSQLIHFYDSLENR